MEINIFAMAAQGLTPGYSIIHDVNIKRLTEPLLSVAAAALAAGQLSCHTAYKERWVSRAELAAMAGFRRKLYDPASPYFVPPEAMMRVAYRLAPVTEASPPYQQDYLTSARRMANYLTALQAEMPPRPFDLHVNNMALDTAPLRRLVAEEAVSAHPSDCGWWLNSDEVSAFLPAGDSFDDPASVWFVDPHDWADHDEVERFVAEHRRYWPEIYGPTEGAVAA